MGSRASAAIVFGIDLGNSDEGWNFERDGYELPSILSRLTAHDEGQKELSWDDLIVEFGGFTESEVEFGPVGTKEYEIWRSQRERYNEAKNSTGLDRDHYGYDFNGNVICIGKNQTSNWGYEPLDTELLNGLPEEEIQKIKDFVLFLDSKGLKLKPEFREPKWLLMAHYG